MTAPVNETYNGYTNYETWLMSLNLDNDQFLNDELHRIANGSKSTYDKSKQLKEWIETTFYNEEHQIYKICDNWTERDFQKIDWFDIVESHIEEE